MAWRENATFGNVSMTGNLWDVSFTVGAEDTNVVNVAMTVTDSVSGAAPGRALALPFYLSSDDAGQTPEAGTDVAPSSGTNGAYLSMADGGSSIAGYAIFETDGTCDIDFTDTGADTYYLNVIMPDGRIETSTVLTFAA